MSTWQNLAWPPEGHHNHEQMAREIEASHIKAREIKLARRARHRQAIFFPWSLALAALVIVFIAAFLLDFMR